MSEDYRCCALEDGHDGPCQWRCATCDCTGECPECDGDGGIELCSPCEFCDGTGGCPDGCIEGWRTEVS